MTYLKALKALGDGDPARGKKILFLLAERMERARAKHPVFADGEYQGLGVIEAECQELAHAVEHEAIERALDEALDVATTALRFVGCEWLKF